MARRKSSPCKAPKVPKVVEVSVLIELPVEVVEDAGNSLAIRDAAGNDVCTRISETSDNEEVDWEIMESIASALNAPHYDV
jgi:hypothetical protein